MLTTDLFIEKFDNDILTDEDVRSIPFDFIDNVEDTKKVNWLPYENGYGYLIFCISDKKRFFIKIKSDNKVFELNYNIY